MARSLIPFVVQQQDGDVVSGADVVISLRSGGAAPIYANETGDAQLGNPVQSNANGRVLGWLDEGSYTFRVQGANVTTYTRALEIIRGEAISKFQDGVAVNADFATSAITTVKLGDGSISGAKVAANQVTNGKIATDAGSTRTLADLGADEPAFVTDSVGTSKLIDGAITGGKFADGTISNGNLQNLGVGSAEVAASAVTTPKLGDGQVTGAKLADGVIAQEHVANATIAPSHLAPSVYPPGCVLMGANTSAPTGWQICDGTAISRAANPLLFAVISTTYGSGDGSTTFNVPDLRGRQLMGRAAGGHGNVNAVGLNDGQSLGSRKPYHAHSQGDFSFGDGWHGHDYIAASDGGCAVWSPDDSSPVWNIYVGNSYVGSFNSGFGTATHGHGITGFTDDTSSGVQNAHSFIALHHFIKLG